MSAADMRPDVEAVMSGLKDFQRATVDYVFRRMYLDEDATRRFLVADEVGLGKTLVARGLIARTIDHLWKDVYRIDVVYVCSNLDIATQNIDRLRLPGYEPYRFASRLTLLPTATSRLDPRVNLVSFTPGTSFEFNQSGLGAGSERRVLYRLLERVWDFHGEAPTNVLRGDQYKVNFTSWLRWERQQQDHTLDEKLANDFAAALEREAASARSEGRPSLRDRFDELCADFARDRKHIPDDQRIARSRLVGALRGVLAHVCVDALEPDLVILDEFQRFKKLLDERSEVGDLAHQLFDWGEARVVLLSATPYKMYTITDESGEEDHYADFLETMRFLHGGRADEVDRLKSLLSEYRRELLGIGPDGAGGILRVRDAVQARLRKVMVRTERLAASADRSGMLEQVPAEGMALDPQDVREYLAVQRITRSLAEHGRLFQGDSTEYWKSAPYLLNFMDAYQLKTAFGAFCERDGAGCEAGPREAACRESICRELSRQERALLDWDAVEDYGELDPGNARLRYVLRQAMSGDAWRLLWLPPALPYYRLGTPFNHPGLKGFTKQLVFSSWAVVPKAVASLVTYAAERRAQLSADPQARNTQEARAKLTGPLRFARGRGERLTGMNVLALMYPCRCLASAVDPILVTATGARRSTPPVSATLKRAEETIDGLLAELSERLPLRIDESLPADERWYWAAPLLLDLAASPEVTRAWLERSDLPAQWAGDDYRGDATGGAWADHVREARALVLGPEIVLGPHPRRLLRVLADVAVAGPGVAALRAMGRVMGPDDDDAGARQMAAARIAWAVRNLFNSPEAIAIVRGLDGQARRKSRDEAYWRRTLAYCTSGCLQAVLDEYFHVVWDSYALAGKPREESLAKLRDAVCGVLAMRAAVLGVDRIEVDQQESVLRAKSDRMRSRFAMPFGNQQGESDAGAQRAGQIREAFNSPFWPFVLTTTSVGQEGLDFHLYCHAIVHWNLPANPVDLEQREGRIHRYKGHAVRKNVAAACASEVLESFEDGDPWRELFDCAKQRRTGQEGDDTELVPYWVYSGRAHIQRHAPVLPLSRDAEHLDALVRSVALYRALIGQPRQEELLAWLAHRGQDEGLSPEDLVMDLSPQEPAGTTAADPG